MAFIRGTYDSQLSAIRRITEGGGLIPLWERGMADAGLGTTAEFDEGDVGVLSLETEEGLGQVCALFTGDRWVARWTSGIVAVPAQPLIAWRP
jgi:hypothetical protein